MSVRADISCIALGYKGVLNLLNVKTQGLSNGAQEQGRELIPVLLCPKSNESAWKKDMFTLLSSENHAKHRAWAPSVNIALDDVTKGIC